MKFLMICVAIHSMVVSASTFPAGILEFDENQDFTMQNNSTGLEIQNKDKRNQDLSNLDVATQQKPSSNTIKKDLFTTCRTFGIWIILILLLCFTTLTAKKAYEDLLQTMERSFLRMDLAPLKSRRVEICAKEILV